MINEDIHGELSLLFHSLALGISLMIFYDVLRIFRKLIKHSTWVIAVEDLFYWMISGICIFIMLYRENNGNLRWFVVAGISLGMLLYNGTISKLLTDRIAKLLQLFFKGLAKIFSILFTPLKYVLQVVKKSANFLEKRGEKLYSFKKKQLKKLAKRVKIITSKH